MDVATKKEVTVLPWQLLECEDDGVDLTLIFALAHELQRWSIAVRVQPVDDVPQMLMTLALGHRAGHPVTAVEIAQLPTSLRLPRGRHSVSSQELARWLRRLDRTTPTQCQVNPRGRANTFATPLVAVAPGQVVAYRVSVQHDGATVGCFEGAFAVVEGHIVSC